MCVHNVVTRFGPVLGDLGMVSEHNSIMILVWFENCKKVGDKIQCQFYLEYNIVNNIEFYHYPSE